MELTINNKKIELKFGAYDAAVLSDVLFAASYGKVAQTTIDNYLDDCEDLEKIFDEVLKEINESNAANLAVKKMKA